MPAANGRRRCYLCAIIGALTLAAAPIADAQLAARRSFASTAGETPQGRPKAAPPQGEDAAGVFGGPPPPQGRPKAAPPHGDDAGVLPAGKAPTGAHDVAIYALGMIGIDYRFGGSTPENGLDCSGLVQHVFQQVTGVTLPRTSKTMSGLGSKVRIDELKPGDLVFFNTRRFSFSHVGIYLGDHRFVHAPSRGGEVEIATLSESYWHKRFDGARRMVGVPSSLTPSMASPRFADSMADVAPADLASAYYAESTP